MTCTGFALLFVYMTCKPVATPPTDTFCQLTKPIYWSVGDSRKTKEQADIHNRKWKRICGGKK